MDYDLTHSRCLNPFCKHAKDCILSEIKTYHSPTGLTIDELLSHKIVQPILKVVIKTYSISSTKDKVAGFAHLICKTFEKSPEEDNDS